jgi:hypothetical protein
MDELAMSDTIVISVIAAIPPTIAALGAMRAARKANGKIEEVHIQVNHRMDQLLARTGEAAGLEATATEKARATAEAHDGALYVPHP